MNIAKCTKAHKYSGFPVRKRKNICAGGEEGIIARMIEFKFLKLNKKSLALLLSNKYHSR